MAKIVLLLALTTAAIIGVSSAPVTFDGIKKRDDQLVPVYNEATNSIELEPPSQPHKRTTSLQLSERNPQRSSADDTHNKPSRIQKRVNPITVFYDNDGQIRVYFATLIGATVAARFNQNDINLIQAIMSALRAYLQSQGVNNFVVTGMHPGGDLVPGAGTSMQRQDFGLDLHRTGFMAANQAGAAQVAGMMATWATRNGVSVVTQLVANAWDDRANYPGPHRPPRRRATTDGMTLDSMTKRVTGENYCQDTIQSVQNLISGPASGPIENAANVDC
ncbi:MAG: hypothetical protein Q9160_001994 [Pyrenula sp. 1 TL-2023]